MPVNRRVSNFQNHAQIIAEQDEDLHSLRTKIGALKAKHDKIEHDLERSRQSFIAREVDFKYRIQELEAENRILLDAKLRWTNTDMKFQRIKSLHKTVIKNIECAQTSTAETLQNQEKDLLRAFRARLYDVETELENERSKSGDTSVWVEKCRMLEADVATRKEVEDKLRTENAQLVKEIRRLRGDVSGEEENKEFIIRQLVTCRKDVIRLQEMLDGEGSGIGKSKKDSIKRQPILEGAEGHECEAAALPDIHNSSSRTKQPLKDMMQLTDNVENKLRKQLVDEKKKYVLLKRAHTAELARTSELERLLRACLEDVRRDIARRQIEEAQLRSFITAPPRSKGGSVSSSMSTIGLHSIGEEEELSPQAVSLGDAESAGKGTDKSVGLSATGESDRSNVDGVSFASNITVDSFRKKDRDNFIATLMSKEQIVTLLYAKLFPPAVSGQQQQKQHRDNSTSSSFKSSVQRGGSGSTITGSRHQDAMSTLHVLSDHDLFGDESHCTSPTSEKLSSISKMDTSLSDSRVDMLQHHAAAPRRIIADPSDASMSMSQSLPGGIVHIPQVPSVELSPVSNSRPGTTGLLRSSGTSNSKVELFAANPGMRQKSANRAMTSGKE